MFCTLAKLSDYADKNSKFSSKVKSHTQIDLVIVQFDFSSTHLISIGITPGQENPALPISNAQKINILTD